jgi:hypothetical protein
VTSSWKEIVVIMQKVLSNRVRYLVELLVVTMVAGKNIQPSGQLLTTVKRYWMILQNITG